MYSHDVYGRNLLPNLFLGMEPAAEFLQKTAVNRDLNPTKKTIFICSTWVTGCLAEQIKHKLAMVHHELAKDFVVYWSFHQRLIERQGFADAVALLLDAGGHVVRPAPKCWIPELAKCDLMIGDVTSMALYFAITGRPVMFTPKAKSIPLAFPSPLAALIDLSPTINFQQPLAEQIYKALSQDVISRAESFRDQHYQHFATNEILADEIRRLYSKQSEEKTV